MTVDTKRLLDRVDVLEIRGDLPARIQALAYDSRKVAPGTCFIALRGTRTDGHRFLSSVESAGAAAAVVEEIPHDVKLPCIRVRDTLATMPLLAIPYIPNLAEYLFLRNRRILADQMEFLKSQFKQLNRGWKQQ